MRPHWDLCRHRRREHAELEMWCIGMSVSKWADIQPDDSRLIHDLRASLVSPCEWTPRLPELWYRAAHNGKGPIQLPFSPCASDVASFLPSCRLLSETSCDRHAGQRDSVTTGGCLWLLLAGLPLFSAEAAAASLCQTDT